MEEREFWQRLEFRISTDLAGSADGRMRHLWCDGLVPEEYDLDGAEPLIRGVAWCGPSGQERWRSTLTVSPEAVPGGRINWAAQLPDSGQTGWLEVDPEARTLLIDPADQHSCG